jgi:hypothetical protein
MYELEGAARAVLEIAATIARAVMNVCRAHEVSFGADGSAPPDVLARSENALHPRSRASLPSNTSLPPRPPSALVTPPATPRRAACFGEPPLHLGHVAVLRGRLRLGRQLARPPVGRVVKPEPASP